MKFTVEVRRVPLCRADTFWDVRINDRKIGRVILSPDQSGDERNAYRDWIIDSPAFSQERFTTVDDAAWRLIRSVVNFEKETLQQRTIVDLNLAKP